MILALDVSGSMSSLDFKQDDAPIDRLTVVQSVVSKFISKRPNDRIGMVAFAGRPYLVSSLTLDHDWLVSNLDRVKIGMVEDGTAIGSAIGASVNRLRDQPSKSKVVVLLTDGVNNAGSVQPELAAQAAKALGVRVYTIAVGSRGDAPMPVTEKDGTTHIVMTKVDVDEATLEHIAETTGGRFFRATDTDSLEQIYASIDTMEKTTHVSDYESAIRLRKGDADAIYNRDFVNRRIAELEKQKDDEKKQQDKPKPDQDKGDKRDRGDKGPDQPKPSQKDPASQAPAPAQPKPGAQEPDGPSGPGELSKSEARALLDSLRGELS